ncbi:MAG: RNA polymerase factor sigma-32 [Myxococcales bacterium]|nr:RNA polymerase factor sigma-32 [Myxococcales bacterium]
MPGDEHDPNESLEEEDELLEGEVIDPSIDELEDIPAGRGTALIRERDTSSALAPRDPLAAYMRDVQKYKLLTPEEERELSIRYVETGDLEAARQLVTSNLRLVVKIAYDYRQAYRNLLDLVQEGNIGLMQAVKKYDPYKGVKLSSYAAWWIRAYMLRYILNNFRLVKVGTTQAQRKLFFNLKKEKARLEAMGITPTPELIAERLGVTEGEVISMDRRLSSGEASLDKPIRNDEGKSITRLDLLESEGENFDEELARVQIEDRLREKIHEFGETLTGKERVIFEQRLLAEEPKTLQDIGDAEGVSRERVRQIEKRLIGKLREYLGKELGESVLEVYEPA